VRAQATTCRKISQSIEIKININLFLELDVAFLCHIHFERQTEHRGAE
jgi:hypothetical protein